MTENVISLNDFFIFVMVLVGGLTAAAALLVWMVNILIVRAVKRRRMAKSAPEAGSGLLAGDVPEMPALLKRQRGGQAALKSKYKPWRAE
jgi:hypothetical protein